MVPGRSLAVGDRGMAATSHPAVTLAAVDMLRSGGNAVDAAIAAIALQGVIDPHMTGIGGDCFAIYAPASGKPVAINGSGRAPAKAELGWFRATAGCRRSRTIHPCRHQFRARSMPGAGSLADYGSKGLDEILAPAIRAAETGFVIDAPRRAGLGTLWRSNSNDIKTGVPVYLPGGVAPDIGGKLNHPALGATLRRIAREGRSRVLRRRRRRRDRRNIEGAGRS